MVFLITGVTGGLGRAVLTTLLSLPIPMSEIIGSTSRLSRLRGDLKETGITFREANFDSPASLDAAFSGVTKLLLVSTNVFDNEVRIKQHRNVIEAAERADVQRIYYTSLALGGLGDDSKMDIMGAHLQTEADIIESVLQYTIIREGVYVDAFPFFLNWWPQTEVVKLPNDGRIAWTSREELGEATAKLMAEDEYFDRFRNRKVLLAAQEALDCRGVTKVISEATGKEVGFEIVALDEYTKEFAKNGRPEWLARVWATTYDGLAKGEGELVDGLMEEVLGRKPITASEWIKKTLRENPEYIWHQQGSLQ